MSPEPTAEHKVLVVAGTYNGQPWIYLTCKCGWRIGFDAEHDPVALAAAADAHRAEPDGAAPAESARANRYLITWTYAGDIAMSVESATPEEALAAAKDEEPSSYYRVEVDGVDVRLELVGEPTVVRESR